MTEYCIGALDGYCEPGYSVAQVVDGCYMFGIPHHKDDDTQYKLYSGIGRGDYLEYNWSLDGVVVGGAWASLTRD